MFTVDSVEKQSDFPFIIESYTVAYNFIIILELQVLGLSNVCNMLRRQHSCTLGRKELEAEDTYLTRTLQLGEKHRVQPK